MARIAKIEFIRHGVATHRRHYVDAEDVKVVLSRLPEALWDRLKRVLFKDDARGNRVYGYTTVRGRRDISLCALPWRVSLSAVCTRHGQSPQAYGALRGSQWPTLAVRRYLLYNTLLHEVGHLQVILPKARKPNRMYASESKAQEFADRWRRALWSEPFDHPDPVHNPPTEGELRLLKAGWAEAHRAFKRGWAMEARREREAAVAEYRRAIELYPNHALAVERLGVLTYASLAGDDGRTMYEESAALLRRAVELDPGLPDAHLYLGMIFGALDQSQEAQQAFARAIELDPYDRIAMTAFADSLSDSGLTVEAEKIFRKVLKRSPEHTLALGWYARHLLSRSETCTQEEAREAIVLLQQVVRLDPNNASAHYQLGLAYSYLGGATGEAVGHFRECLRLKPDHKKAAERLAELVADDGGGGHAFAPVAD